MIESSKEDYERMLKERDDMIDAVLKALRHFKEHKQANLIPLLDRLIHERNELDLQRAEAVQQFQMASSKYWKRKLHTERFDAAPTEISV